MIGSPGFATPYRWGISEAPRRGRADAKGRTESHTRFRVARVRFVRSPPVRTSAHVGSRAHPSATHRVGLVAVVAKRANKPSAPAGCRRPRKRDAARGSPACTMAQARSGCMHTRKGTREMTTPVGPLARVSRRARLATVGIAAGFVLAALAGGPVTAQPGPPRPPSANVSVFATGLEN